MVKASVLRSARVLSNYRQIKFDIDKLSPWYQPIPIGLGLSTIATDKNGKKIRVASTDRGVKKWKKFIKPGMPFDLQGKRVLEIGCNAGLFPLYCARKLGARETVGIEKDNHYYSQAIWMLKTMSKIDNRYIPTRFYQGSMENFDYESLGCFDIVFMFAVIYHIGKSDDYSHLSQKEVRQLQVDTLIKVSKITPLIVFQANPLQDEGRGKGIESLKSLVDEAGLVVEKETNIRHLRGYTLVARSNRFNNSEMAPISQMCNKSFLPAAQSAEFEAAMLVNRNPDIDAETMLDSRYGRLRTGRSNWLSPGESHLPKTLSVPPQYWVVPWSVKQRNSVSASRKIKNFPNILEKFKSTVSSVMESGFDSNGQPIPVFKLVHPKYGSVFVYIDGNQRMGVLALRNEEDMEIPVSIQQTILREKVCSLPLARQLVREGCMSESDVLSWFDNAFWFLRK